MTILLLIRHAHNDYLKEGRLAGSLPGVHLNPEGQRQAQATARRLAHTPIAAIYSSPLERAVETARAIAAPHQLNIQIREELSEIRIGEWTGKTIQELQETKVWKQMQAHPVGVAMPGGESIDQVQKRMVAALDAIVAAHPHQIVAIVSHADPLKAALAHYLGMDLNTFQKIAIEPASITILAFDARGATLLRSNDSEEFPVLETDG